MRPTGPIHLLERDYFLKLDDPHWPPADLPILGDAPVTVLKDSWAAGPWKREWDDNLPGGFLWRQLHKEGAQGPRRELFEAVIRFPSAPLFGCQRKRDYQVRLKPVHQHTFRLLTSVHPTERKRIDRIFLLLNGLNEIDHLGFYYDLAGMLIENPQIACIVPPYPGHLTRYPMLGRYAEKPLQRFITDPSDLFRQYLRFMIEMQWLLSVLAPVSSYPVAPGIGLLAEGSEPQSGRNDPDQLSDAIVNAWKTIFEGSSRSFDSALTEARQGANSVSREDVYQSVAVTRHLIGWQPYTKPLTDWPQTEHLPSPRLHVVGYSLGGYLAQSAFFTWPYAIASCTTLCSGGALHEIRPVKFAHEEEWRAITHGLNYELESGMLEARFKIDPPLPGQDRSVCGIPASYFSSHFRIFNDVFLQDPRGSYRSRVTEFVPRLLFVVGGNDPIVTTRSVLEASPREGINMIEIANLSHFIANEGGEWSGFWLPTIAKIMSALSIRAEALMATSVLSNLWNPETTGSAREEDWTGDVTSPRTRTRTRQSAEPLGSGPMQDALFDLVRPLEDGHSFLMILRNQVPAALMGKRMLHRRGSVPHFEDFQIRSFWAEMQKRRRTMLLCAHRITLVVPGRLNEWFVHEPSLLSVNSLPLTQEVSGQEGLRNIWNDFLEDWEAREEALHRFEPERVVDFAAKSLRLERLVREETSTPEKHPVLNCLPDVWIGLSRKLTTELAGNWAKREDIHSKFVELAALILEQSRARAGADIERLDEWLEDGTLSIVRISPARSNPRFLGERIRSRDSAVDLLVHSALALARSTPCKNKGDFGRGWPARSARSAS